MLRPGLGTYLRPVYFNLDGAADEAYGKQNAGGMPELQHRARESSERAGFDADPLPDT